MIIRMGEREREKEKESERSGLVDERVERDGELIGCLD